MDGQQVPFPYAPAFVRRQRQRGGRILQVFATCGLLSFDACEAAIFREVSRVVCPALQELSDGILCPPAEHPDFGV